MLSKRCALIPIVCSKQNLANAIKEMFYKKVVGQLRVHSSMVTTVS